MIPLRLPRPRLITTALLLIWAPDLRAQAPRNELDSVVFAASRRSLALYRELLRYRNDAHQADDILVLVSWLEAALARRDFRTQRLETGGSPLLFAERRHAGADRTVLVYLQADGQPVDPSRWEQPSPYEPVLKERQQDGEWRTIPWERLTTSINPEWRVFARSAADSKGPIAQFLSALDALSAIGRQPAVNLKVIVDTEEELGSPRLPAAIRANRALLQADDLLVLDGPPHSSGAPTIVFGARGIVTFTLTAYGPQLPQHSGHYGNYLPNPARELARVVASFSAANGRVLIPGWYDGIVLDSATLAILDSVPDQEESIRSAMGVAMTDSVAPTLQRSLQYPSLNIRGISSGWIGSQARTIVPAEAIAEFDVRLVVESDPTRLLMLVREHLERLGYVVLSRKPTSAERVAYPRLITMTHSVPYHAFRTPMDAPIGVWLTSALTKQHSAPPVRIRTGGGSIPISPFVATLGIPAAILPTVNPDNNQHSPNENLAVGAFLGGITTIATTLLEPFPRR